MKLLKNLTLCICIILSISLIGCSSKTTVQSSSSTKVTENKNTDEKSEDQESFTCSICNKKYPISQKRSIKNVAGAVVATGCKYCIAKLPQDADDSGDTPSKKYECGICGGDSRYCDCCRECGNTAEDCICYDSEVQGGEDF